MSEARAVIAKANGVKEEEVRCEKCQNSSDIIYKWLWCSFWEIETYDDRFCIFWRRKKGRLK